MENTYENIYMDNVHHVLKNKLGIEDYEKLRYAEADFFALRFNQLMENNQFKPTLDHFKYIHYYLFQDVYDFAGQYRQSNIEKQEETLQWESVQYYDYKDIKKKLFIIFKEIEKINLDKFSLNEKTQYIMEIMIRIWQVHPFPEGNTRTTMIFICGYCEYLGLIINRNLLANNFEYVRKSLVAACYENKVLDKKPNKKFLLEILSDMIVDDGKKKVI